MTAVTVAIAEVYVICWASNGQAIVAVENDVVLEQQVRALGGEAYEPDLINNRLLSAI